MNINCPNCSAYLTVPEQYAGQLMKCPKCSNNFTVPALPPGENEPAFSMAQNPPAPPPVSTPAASSQMAPPIPFAPEVPAFSTAAAQPAFATSPPPSSIAAGGPTAPGSSSPASTATSTPRTSSTASQASAAGAATAGPTGERRTVSITLPLMILQWVPLASIVLIFFLQFFPWVGVYPGGVAVVEQGAWGAAFGDYGTPDPDMKDVFTIYSESSVRNLSEEERARNPYKAFSNEPAKSLILIFYLFPFFLLTLIVSIGVAVLPYLQVKLPPAVENLLPWKWAIIAGLNGVLLLFLSIQVFAFNFPLESSVKDWGQKAVEAKVLRSANVPNVKELGREKALQMRAEIGAVYKLLQRTFALRLAYLLHIISTIAAALVYWMEKHRVQEVHLEGVLRW